jgi:hypothetical protein
MLTALTGLQEDNRPMNKQRGLLPWILGALAVATVAVVVAVASSGKTITPASHPADAAVAQPTSTPELSPTPAPGPAPVAPAASMAPVPSPAVLSAASGPEPEAEAARLPAVQGQDTAEPAPQAGQIWQCMTNGVKTFSNNPCGEKSTLLEVRAINTMNPTPVVRYARAYAPEPRDSQAYAEPNSYSDQDDVYGEQGAADAPGNSYGIVQGFAFLPRKRPEHPHRPMHHHPGPPPRRN